MLSLPSRERGLKYGWLYNPQHLQGRSLRGSVDWNFFQLFQNTRNRVAPFAGAWIEILAVVFKTPAALSLPSRERGLKSLLINLAEHGRSRSLRGSVDWNMRGHGWVMEVYSRSLRGSVDWNRFATTINHKKYRRSLRGSVDWNGNLFFTSAQKAGSLPSRERGLKYNVKKIIEKTCDSRSLRGSVDWNLTSA